MSVVSVLDGDLAIQRLLLLSNILAFGLAFNHKLTGLLFAIKAAISSLSSELQMHFWTVNHDYKLPDIDLVVELPTLL